MHNQLLVQVHARQDASLFRDSRQVRMIFFIEVSHKLMQKIQPVVPKKYIYSEKATKRKKKNKKHVNILVFVYLYM